MSSSRLGSVSDFDINADVDCILLPNYEEPTVNLVFENIAQFEEWFNTVAMKHAKFIYRTKKEHTRNLALQGQPLETSLPLVSFMYLCNHAGKPKAYAPKNEHAQNRTRINKSIKIGCTASIYRSLLTDNSVHVKYHWTYPDHDPHSLNEITKSRLPPEVRKWIEDHVDADMNWPTIRKLLRLNETRLQEVNFITLRSYNHFD